MALTVAGISLVVGTFTVTKILVPAVDAWAKGRELWFGAAVVIAVLVAFVAAMRAARRYVVVART
jgi:high-affinity nickel-transport protein